MVQPRIRVFPILVLTTLLITTVFWTSPGRVTRVQADSTAPRLYIDHARQYATVYKGSDRAMRMMSAHQATALSLASEDFDSDGIADLAVGFASSTGGLIAIHRGNLDAFAPQSEASFWAIARSEFPSPYLPEAQLIEIPNRADFLAAGDFIGHDAPGVVAAARGGSQLHVLARNVATGAFELMQSVNVSGSITAVDAHRLRNGKYAHVLVGTHDVNGSHLLIYRGSNEGLSLEKSVALPGDATSFAFGNLDGDGIEDTLIVAGGRLSVLHGGSQTIDSVETAYAVSGVATGRFLFDRGSLSQVAALASDGSLHILAQEGIDSRPFTNDEVRAKRMSARSSLRGATPVPAPAERRVAWQEIESYPAMGTAGGNGQGSIMFRTRVSNNGADDVMLLNSARMSVLAHIDQNPASGVVMNRSDLGADVAAALPVRVNVDGRPGLVMIKRGETIPHVMMPLPDPTFTVNRMDDPTPVSPITNACNGGTNDCSLREAILRSNGDTVMVPAGTYTLSIGKVANDCTGKFGALSAEHSVTIVGAGQNSTIIQAGTVAYNAGTANGVDMVMNVNEDLATSNCPVTSASASISNLTIQNGHNRGSQGFDGDGGCMEFDTGSSGTATLTLTSVTLQNCDTTQGGGGGLVIFSSIAPTGGGGATISNSTIQGNSVVAVGQAGNGGGVAIAQDAHMTMTASQITNNKATQNNSNGIGSGGGIVAFAPQNVSAATGETFIHSSTISGNKSAGFGGAINSSTDLSIDQGTLISGNAAGTDGTNTIANMEGGGIYSNPLSVCPLSSTCTTTLSKVTLTGNSTTGNGGAISHGNDSADTTGSLNMSFSRLAGNASTGGSGSNLSNNHATATVTDNWWGTNSASSTINGISATTTFDPFIVLAFSASPSTIKINATSTLTADMSKDNHGSGTALAGNLGALNGVPVTFSSGSGGSITNSQPESLNSNAQATATFQAGGSGGSVTTQATVDQQTLSATITILQPPSMTKSFNPTHVPTNTASTLTFSITNPNTVTIDANFTDNLPSGLVVAATPSVSNGCGGTVTATANATSISFTNASLAAGSCTIKVNVSAAADNTYNNSVTLDSTIAGNATSPATATLTVINPPSIAKAFSPTTIALGQTSTLTFTITNSNLNLGLNGIAFTDTLPSGVTVENTGAAGTCNGTATANGGSGTISLTGATLGVNTSCTVIVSVTGTTAGVKNNTTGNVTSTDAGGLTGNTATATLTVVAPPSIAKSFTPNSIPVNGSSTLSFTLTNPNTGVALTGVGFSDTLPSGLVVATPNGLSNPTCGGTVTAVAGSGSVALANGSLAANGSCTLTINVTSATAGSYTNTTGAVSSNEGGAGNTATANLTVVAAPSIAKAFNPASIAVNGTSTLTFTLTNPTGNTVAEAGVAFSDTFPSGVQVAATPGATNTCGGTFTANANATSVNLTGGSIAINSSCTISVSVTGTTSGVKTNTTGTVSSTNGGTGNTATANLTVATPPSIAKAFNPAQVAVNGTSSLTFTITNPNTSLTLTGVGFTDSLPSGVTVASSTATVCGGTLTTTNPTSISLSGATIAASGTCQFSVTVTGATAGVKTNTTGAVTSNEAGAGNTATANLTVVAPPSIAKSFTPNSIALNATSSLTFTITNPNTSLGLTGVGFTDSLPAGLTVANATATACGGTLTTTNPTSISLSGATVAASGTCQFSVTVTGVSAGLATNTTGAVTSNEGGTGNTASASITVVGAPSMTKAFNPTTVGVNQVSTMTITITNAAGNPALTGVAFNDPFPAGLQVAATPNATNTCGGTFTANANATSVSLTGGTIAGNTSCAVTVSVTPTAGGAFSNTAGPVSSTNGGTGNTATATITSGGSLGGSFGAKSGAENARQWIINIGNGTGAPAMNPQVTGLTLTQTLGAACTPVISGLPAAASPNPIAAGQTGQATVTIDFSSCTGRVFFKAVATVAADGGAVTGTITALNQLP